MCTTWHCRWITNIPVPDQPFHLGCLLVFNFHISHLGEKKKKVTLIICSFMPRKTFGPTFPLLDFLPSWKSFRVSAHWNAQQNFLIALTFLMVTWITGVCSWREWDSILQSTPCSQCYYAFLSNDSCKSISWSRDQKTGNPPLPPFRQWLCYNMNYSDLHPIAGSLSTPTNPSFFAA